jgi:hypothetical protein
MDDKSQEIAEKLVSFEKYRAHMLKAILGFLANLVCIEKFEKELIKESKNLATMLCNCLVKINDNEVWHRALYLLDGFRGKIKLDANCDKHEI